MHILLFILICGVCLADKSCEEGEKEPVSLGLRVAEFYGTGAHYWPRELVQSLDPNEIDTNPAEPKEKERDSPEIYFINSDGTAAGQYTPTVASAAVDLKSLETKPTEAEEPSLWSVITTIWKVLGLMHEIKAVENSLAPREKSLAIAEKHMDTYVGMMMISEFRQSQVQLLEDAEHIVSLPFGDQFRFGHYVAREMMKEDQSIWLPWMEYMIYVEYPIRMKDGRYGYKASGNIAHIMSCIPPTYPIWLQLAHVLVNLQGDFKTIYNRFDADFEKYKDMDFEAVIGQHTGVHVARMLDDPEYARDRAANWEEAESIHHMTFADQAKFGDYVTRHMMREDENVRRSYLHEILANDLPFALKHHIHSPASIGNTAYIISRLQPTDTLWIRFVYLHIQILADFVLKDK
jgi:hypothetical protein